MDKSDCSNFLVRVSGARINKAEKQGCHGCKLKNCLTMLQRKDEEEARQGQKKSKGNSGTLTAPVAQFTNKFNKVASLQRSPVVGSRGEKGDTQNFS